MKQLVLNINTKESRLSNAVCMFRTNCMDTGTTSPVEAQNRVFKHGPMKVDGQMNLDKAMETIVQYQKWRLHHRQLKVTQSMGKKTTSSLSSTHNMMNKKDRHLLIRTTTNVSCSKVR